MAGDKKPKNRLLKSLGSSNAKSNPNQSSSIKKLISNKRNRQSFSFEEDDGFVFKRANSSQEVAKELPPIDKLPKKRPIKVKDNKTDTPIETPVPVIPKKRGRPKKPPINTTTKTDTKQIETPSDDELKPLIKTKKRGRKLKQEFTINKPKQDPLSPPISSPSKPIYDNDTSIQMLLPTLDSPIQRRNKSLRDSSKRRSSLGNRGKRVSSIGNGFTATPHTDVPVQDFYKHLDDTLPEPHKMRKLLIWCSKRLLNTDNENLKKLKINSNSDDLTLFNIAKVIKEEIIRDLVDGNLNTSWYSRQITNDDEQVKMLPNVQNLTNLSNIKILEKRLSDLKNEKLLWQKLYDQVPHTINPPHLQPIESELTKPVTELSKSFNEFKDNSITKNSLEFKIDNLEKLINNLQSNTDILTRIQHQLKSHINYAINEVNSNNSLSDDKLLKGIAKLINDN